MKKVFSNSELPHVWANQQQDNGKTSNGSFYFNGNTIYSYSSHFPIAQHFNSAEKGYKVLFTLDTYGVTTAKHVSLTYRAIPDKSTVLYMKNVPQQGAEISHDSNIKHWENEITHAFDKWTKARKKEVWIETINGLIEQVNAYIEYFNIEISASLALLIEAAKGEKFADYLAGEADRINAARVEKAKEHAIKVNEAVTKWRNYETARVDLTNDVDYLRLSKDGKEIETSQGLKFEIARCKALYLRVKAQLIIGECKGNCDVYFNANQYTVKEITKKYIVIGCHKIETGEYETIANKLGWV